MAFADSFNNIANFTFIFCVWQQNSRKCGCKSI